MGRGWVSVLVGLTLVLAGCSGSTSDQPKVLPPVVTPSASPSVSSTVSAGPVVVPSAAVPATPQGAAAFVRFFYGELNAAFQDGHDERIRRLSDRLCATCNNYADAVAAGTRARSRIVGITFASLDVAAALPKNGSTLVTVVGSVPKRQENRNGVLSTLPAEGSFNDTVALQRHGSRWIVRAIRFEKR